MTRQSVFLAGGWDAQRMNGAIRALTGKAIGARMEGVGVRYGYEGLNSGDFFPLGACLVGSAR